MELKHLLYLYPNIPKPEAISSYVTNLQRSPKPNSAYVPYTNPTQIEIESSEKEEPLLNLNSPYFMETDDTTRTAFDNDFPVPE